MFDGGAGYCHLSVAKFERDLVAGAHSQQLPDGFGEGDLTLGCEGSEFQDAGWGWLSAFERILAGLGGGECAAERQ